MGELVKYINTRLCRNSDFENMIEMSFHPDLTLEVLVQNRERAWGFHYFHEHPNFTFEWVEHFQDRFWNWNKLSQKATVEDVKRYPNFLWNWEIITENTHYKTMMENPGLPWAFGRFYLNTITEEHIPFLEMFEDRIPNWKWGRLSRHVSWSIFKKTLHLHWIWYASNVTINPEEFVEEDVEILKEFDILFNWVKLSMIININIINANPDLPWVYEFLQWNKSTWTTKSESIEECVRKWTAANTIKRHWKVSNSDPRFKICRKRLIKEFKDFKLQFSTMASVSFYKIRPDAIIPSKATPGSIGLDLHSVEPYVVLPGQRIVVSTGLQVSLPTGTYGRIAPRSGLAVKHGLDVGAGVIDSDYTGEVRVVLFNHDQNVPFIIRPGYRIAQLILEQALDPVVNESTVPFDGTERGSGGFGSSGDA